MAGEARGCSSLEGASACGELGSFWPAPRNRPTPGAGGAGPLMDACLVSGELKDSFLTTSTLELVREKGRSEVSDPSARAVRPAIRRGFPCLRGSQKA